MKKIIFYRLFLTILVLFACTSMSNAQTFTQEDRARLIRTETKLEELEKRMVEGFEQVDKRFEQVDKRFEDNFTYMGYLITLFGGMFAAIVAFALWDRRTMIRPFERKVSEIENEILKLKKDKNSGKMLAALRDLAKTDLKLAEILKSHNLL
jgi:Skp family chaperone for outer membrane proteins